MESAEWRVGESLPVFYLVRDDRGDRVWGEFFPAFERAELDEHGDVCDGCAELGEEFGGCRGSAAGGEEVVDEENRLVGLDGVLVDFYGGVAVFKAVG